MEKRKMLIAKIILIVFSIVFLFSIYQIIIWYLDNYETKQIIEQLHDITSMQETKQSITTEVLDRTNYYDEALLSVDFTN